MIFLEEYSKDCLSLFSFREMKGKVDLTIPYLKNSAKIHIRIPKSNILSIFLQKMFFEFDFLRNVFLK